jgi:glycine oxidase
VKKHDVAIVGGGLLGRTLAWRMAVAGLEPALYDAHDRLGKGATAWVAGNMIALQAEAVDAEPEIVAMGRRSLELWPEWLKQSSGPVYFSNSGTLLVWHRADTGEARRFETLLRTRDPLAAFERLNASQLCARESLLGNRFSESLFLRNEANVDNRQLLAALAESLDALGVDCFWNRRVDDSEPLDASLVIDCRGRHAKSRWRQLRGVRGEIVRLHAPGVELKHMVRLLHPRYSLYLIPRPGNNLVIGATSVESEDCTPVSVRGTLELLSAAYVVLPELAEARILELNSECRPALPDNQPSMRYTPNLRLLEINGLYRHGFLLTPAIVEAVVNFLPDLLRNPMRELSQISQWPLLHVAAQKRPEQELECQFS